MASIEAKAIAYDRIQWHYELLKKTRINLEEFIRKLDILLEE